MSEMQQYYDNFRTGLLWAHPEADQCLCRGSGYALSEVDTWHECRYHHVPGQPHPEEEYPEDWDHEAELAKYKAEKKTTQVKESSCWVEKESALESCPSTDAEDGTYNFDFGDDIPF
jgi:hypothetical protein